VPTAYTHRDLDAYTTATAQAPRLPWAEFMHQLDWRQGEHFGFIGPTGQGKSVMMTSLLPRRDYVVVMATKPRDTTLSALPRWRPWCHDGYVTWPQWHRRSAKVFPRRIIWPKFDTLSSDARQRAVFETVLDETFREGGWTLAADEGYYLSQVLGLGPQLRIVLLQGRSLGVSLMIALQRARYAPLEVYSQATHLMMWRDSDEANIGRLAELNAVNPKAVEMLVARLDQHQALYINTRTGFMCRTRYQSSELVLPSPTLPQSA
jgi:hypothetical protein